MAVESRSTGERRKEQTRRELVGAAADVFARRGYQVATLDEIAQAAGYTKGAVYTHFDTKEELFLAVMRTRQQTMVEGFFGAGREAPREDAHVDAMADAFARLAPSDAEWALWSEFRLYALRHPHVREQLEAYTRALLAAVVENTRARWRTLGVKPPLAVDKLARLYMALFEGLVSQRSVDPAAVPDRLFGELVTFLDESMLATSTRSPRR